MRKLKPNTEYAEAQKRVLPRPPDHLKAPGRALWRQLHTAYLLDKPEQLALAQIAAEQADIITTCREAVDEQGRFQPTRWGTLQSHPGVQQAEVAYRVLLSAFRGLALDGASLAELGYD